MSFSHCLLLLAYPISCHSGHFTGIVANLPCCTGHLHIFQDCRAHTGLTMASHKAEDVTQPIESHQLNISPGQKTSHSPSELTSHQRFHTAQHYTVHILSQLIDGAMLRRTAVTSTNMAVGVKYGHKLRLRYKQVLTHNLVRYRAIFSNNLWRALVHTLSSLQHYYFILSHFCIIRLCVVSPHIAAGGDIRPHWLPEPPLDKTILTRSQLHTHSLTSL